MDKAWLQEQMVVFVDQAPENTIDSHQALMPDLVGLRLYDGPILRVGAAEDPLFAQLKAPEAVGDGHTMPEDWVAGAKSVISLFFPLTKEVREANRQDMSWPAKQWLHGRIEGQVLINRAVAHLRDLLRKLGHAAAPSVEPEFRFFDKRGRKSNWSERHVAYICGMGTFGFSKGLITERGMAGRLGSVVTDMELKPDGRPYKELYEYCTHCGACVKNCPAGAIDITKGKDHDKCSDFLDQVRTRYERHYGCGKCQVKVPCESRIPGRGINAI